MDFVAGQQEIVLEELTENRLPEMGGPLVSSGILNRNIFLLPPVLLVHSFTFFANCFTMLAEMGMPTPNLKMVFSLSHVRRWGFAFFNIYNIFNIFNIFIFLTSLKGDGP